MSRITEVLKAKKMNGFSWDELADHLPISSAGLRAAFSRGQVSDFYLEKLEQVLKINQKQSVVNESSTIYESEKDGSLESMIIDRIMKKVTPIIEDLNRKVKVLEFKQDSIRKDFHLMFERQLEIESDSKIEQQKKKSGS